jgi:hypothetical protein
MFSNNRSYYNKEPEQRCMTDHRIQKESLIFYKTFVKFRNSKINVLKIVLIIVNINKDENKSLISNHVSLYPPFCLSCDRF